MEDNLYDTPNCGDVLLSAEFYPSASGYLDQSFWLILCWTDEEYNSHRRIRVFQTEDEGIQNPIRGTSEKPIKSERVTVVSDGSSGFEEGCRMIEEMVSAMTGGEPILSEIVLLQNQCRNYARRLKQSYQTALTSVSGELETATFPLSG